MHRLLRRLLVVMAVLLVLLLLSPWLVYEALLLHIDGRPARPLQLASAPQQAQVWRRARGSGPLQVTPINPYAVLYRLVSDSRVSDPGELLAYWVSSEHISTRGHVSMLDWHLSNLALTIWLTRHWSAEEMATFMVPVVARWPPPRPRNG